MKQAYLLMVVYFILLPQITCAELKVSAGQYELHYNTFPSTFLSTEIANRHQITRSKNRGLISISVIDTSQESPIAVAANIDLKANNILNQNKEIELFKIVEENKAIYYLGSFALNDQEDVNFNITATPIDTDVKLHVKFSREFFTK